MIDSHCHLDFDKFDRKREQALADAREAGVHTVINIGTDVPSSEKSVALAERFDMVYATVGIHPHDAKRLDERVLGRLRELAAHDRVVAIGEIGLDFYRDLSPRDVQAKAFRKQLELAIETKLPIVIHTRESFRETVGIVKEYAGDLTGGVFHCFPGNVPEADEVINMGFVISVGGVITFDKASMARVAAAVPLGKIILETDAPFLTPVPYRGKQNFPAYVRFVYEKLADLKDLSVIEVEKTVDRTVEKLFGLAETFGG